MALLAAILLLAAPQEDDLQRRIRALVDQLQSDEIQAVDDAVAGLVALGGPALDPLRDEIKKASGDAKLRLEEAVRSIERNGRRGRALGAPVLVTLRAEDRPLADALEEFRKSSGQPLKWKELPPGKLTISLEKAPFWEALDRLCKAQGGIMWSVKEKEILISKGPYRDLPKVFRGNQVLYFGAVSSEKRRYGIQVSPNTTLEGAVAWVRGAGIPRSVLQVDDFRDDQGTDLVVRAAGGIVGFTVNLGSEDPLAPESLVRDLSFSQNITLHDDAKTLTRLRGEARLEYTLDFKRLALLEKPQGAVGRPLRAGALTVTLKRFQVMEGMADVRVHISSPNVREKLPLRTDGFRLLDAKGKFYAASGWLDDNADEDAGKIEYDASLDFTLPEGKIDVVALEITVPTDLETISIPFDFKDLPLR